MPSSPQQPQHADPNAASTSAFRFPEFERKFGDQYGVTKELAGRGKFAKVYVAYDLKSGRKVAARVAQVEDEDPHEETKVLRKLHKTFEKPYVVEYLQKYENGTHFIMFMEFCEGGSLEQALKARKGPLPYHIAKRFFAQLTHALKCMADIKVSHRDLKPANVMLTSPNLEDAEIRLIDFGFAKRANMMHSVKGTPAYMAPERVMRESYDFGAEIYAAGVILFEMLYGFQPFAAASSALGIYKSQKTLQLPEAPAVPIEAQDMIRRCLDVDPQSRIKVEEMLAHPFLSGSTPPPTPQTPSPAGSAPPANASGSTTVTATSPATTSPATTAPPPRVPSQGKSLPDACVSPLTSNASGSPVADGAPPFGGSITAAPTPQSGFAQGAFPECASPPKEVALPDATSCPAGADSTTTPTDQNAPGVKPAPLVRPPLHPPAPGGGAVPPGALTPMVKHSGMAAPTAPPPLAPTATVISPESAPASGRLGPSSFPSPAGVSMPALGMAEDGPGSTLLEGAAAIIGICRSSGMDPGERIVLAAYAVDAAKRAGRAIADAQAASTGMCGLGSAVLSGGADDSVPRMGTMTKTFTTSTNAGMEGGLHGSFSSPQPRVVSSSFALSAVSSVALIKTRAKEVVTEALQDLRNPDAETQPPQTLLVNYVRRALLCAARQEYMKDPHCAYGPVLEVYARCDVLVALLLRDDAMAESKSLARLREKLADRIIAAHSSCGPFANFSQGELYSSQHSATRMA